MVIVHVDCVDITNGWMSVSGCQHFREMFLISNAFHVFGGITRVPSAANILAFCHIR